MRVLLLGRNGQVGWELERMLAPAYELTALERSQCDLRDPDQVLGAVRDARPQVIVNAAAYTAVDRAETEAHAATVINARAPALLAAEARRVGAYLLHYSTDYVFDGAKRSPYVESDPTNPMQVYGRTKLEGEAAIRASGCRHLILRTSWVYAGRGKNFMLAILARARSGAPLRVVNDQRGTPTWAHDVAALTAALLKLKELPAGTFHAASAGDTTWFDFALEILRRAGVAAAVEPVSTADYGSPTPRPLYTVLDSRQLGRASGIPPIGDWRDRLSAFDDLEVLSHLGRLP
ncbi:MAG: dTDP-4-dehydrorhamnose reductase [Betaproteobacteria bacterium]